MDRRSKIHPLLVAGFTTAFAVLGLLVVAVAADANWNQLLSTLRDEPLVALPATPRVDSAQPSQPPTVAIPPADRQIRLAVDRTLGRTLESVSQTNDGDHYTATRRPMVIEGSPVQIVDAGWRGLGLTPARASVPHQAASVVSDGRPVGRQRRGVLACVSVNLAEAGNEPLLDVTIVSQEDDAIPFGDIEIEPVLSDRSPLALPYEVVLDDELGSGPVPNLPRFWTNQPGLPAVVPEPSLLAVMGLLFAGARRRR